MSPIHLTCSSVKTRANQNRYWVVAGLTVYSAFVLEQALAADAMFYTTFDPEKDRQEDEHASLERFITDEEMVLELTTEHAVLSDTQRLMIATEDESEQSASQASMDEKTHEATASGSSVSWTTIGLLAAAGAGGAVAATAKGASDDSPAQAAAIDTQAKDSDNSAVEDNAADTHNEDGMEHKSSEYPEEAHACGSGVLPQGAATVNDFTLTDIDGNEHTLSDYHAAGKMVVMEFLSSLCSHCDDAVNNTRTLENLIDNYSDQVVVLSLEVNAYTSTEDMENGYNGNDFTDRYTGIHVFNVEESDLSSIKTYTDFTGDVCGTPGIYAVNNQFEITAFDRYTYQDDPDGLFTQLTAFNSQTDDDQANTVEESESEQAQANAQSVEAEIEVPEELGEVLSYVYSQMGTVQSPDWITEDIFGQSVQLSNLLEDGPVIVEFISQYCGHCKNFVETGVISHFAQTYQDVNVVIVEANHPTATSLDEIKQFLGDDDLTDNHETFIDNAELNSVYGLQYVPAMLVINSEQNILSVPVGAFSTDYASGTKEELAENLYDEIMAFEMWGGA